MDKEQEQKETKEEEFNFMDRIDPSSYNIENRPFNIQDMKVAH